MDASSTKQAAYHHPHFTDEKTGPAGRFQVKGGVWFELSSQTHTLFRALKHLSFFLTLGLVITLISAPLPPSLRLLGHRVGPCRATDSTEKKQRFIPLNSHSRPYGVLHHEETEKVVGAKGTGTIEVKFVDAGLHETLVCKKGSPLRPESF